MKSTEPEGLVGKKLLKEYHSVLFRLSGIVTDFVDTDGKIFQLCPEEHVNPVCSAIRSTGKGRSLCAVSDRKMFKCRETRTPAVYRCHAGFIDIVVPLFVNKKYIGSLTAGQILNKKPDEKSYRVFREKTSYLDVDEKRLHENFFHVKVLSDNQINALVELLKLIGNYIVESEDKLLFLESAAEKEKILLARKYIENKFKETVTVAEIATHVYMSESYFSHQFKEQVGISPVQYLNRYRIEKALQLLKKGTLSKTEIAFEAGFNTLTHFNRIFKKFMKLSPSEYQKSRNGKKIS
jgi:AraC-like DNA-binding protein/ligand-binding sensor protein